MMVCFLAGPFYYECDESLTARPTLVFRHFAAKVGGKPLFMYRRGFRSGRAVLPRVSGLEKSLRK